MPHGACLVGTICQLGAASCNCSQKAMLCDCVCGGKCQLCYGSCKNITQTCARRRRDRQQRSRKIILYISMLSRELHSSCFSLFGRGHRAQFRSRDGRYPRKARNNTVDLITNCVTHWQRRRCGASPNWRRQSRYPFNDSRIPSYCGAQQKCSGASTNFPSATSCLVRQTR
jgi:hypothetical protein